MQHGLLLGYIKLIWPLSCGCLYVGILLQCLAGSFLEMCKEIDALRVIVFTIVNMVMHLHAQIFLT